MYTATNCVNIEVTSEHEQSVIPENLLDYGSLVYQTFQISPQAYFTEGKMKALMSRNFSDKVLLSLS
jgi:hypothetical protein